MVPTGYKQRAPQKQGKAEGRGFRSSLEVGRSSINLIAGKDEYYKY